MTAFWTRDRDTNAESEDATAAGARARSRRLTAVDRCDRCGAQAYVRVVLHSSQDLLFCAHHYRQHAVALTRVAAGIQDETQRLTADWPGSRG